MECFEVTDLFCGAGGATEGMVQAEVHGKQICRVTQAVNHDPYAIASHEANHKETAHFIEDITKLDEKKLKKSHILWASLECTNFSNAKGGKSRDADSRSLADHMPRYLRAIEPNYFIVENVREFMSWGPLVHKKRDGKLQYDKNGHPILVPESRTKGKDYYRWVAEIESLGYYHQARLLNAADFGAFTSRIRLFIIFAKKGLPIAFPEATHSKGGKTPGTKKWNAVKQVLDFSDEGRSIFEKKLDKKSGRWVYKYSPKSYKRIHSGCIRHIAGGKDAHEAFLMQVYGADSKGHNTYRTDRPARTITTADGHVLVNIEKSHFIAKNYSGNPYDKNISVEGPAGTITTADSQSFVTADKATFLTQYNSDNDSQRNKSVEDPCGVIPTANRFGLVQAHFINQRNGDGDDRSSSINDPAKTVTTTGGNQEMVTASFLHKYYGSGTQHESVDAPAGAITTKARHALVQTEHFIANYHHSSDSNSVDNPSPTLTTHDKLGLVQAEHFIVKQYNAEINHSSIDEPAGTITQNPKHALIAADHFIERQFSSGTQDSSVENPAGSVTTVPKMRLVTAERDGRDGFILQTHFNNTGTSLESPSPVLVASRHHHYIINPTWGGNSGSVEDPSHTIVARQDKAPLSIVSAETGEGYILVYDDDPDYIVELKEFMALYGITDIKMRMLKVLELLKIQGFPEDYVLLGNQTLQKKFIGNSVVPEVARAIVEALWRAVHREYKQDLFQLAA